MEAIYAEDVTVTNLSTVKVRANGQITLPAEIRRRLKIKAGSLVTVLQLGRLVLVMPGAAVVQREGKAIQQLMKKKGVTLADLL